mmetsp:Transcript_16818/g.49527  ORF Transcript_16818/g.49527 Transcript_16818/m.49527 type:complete len:274 (-) Transcript_16818:14-835(-)
MQGGLWGVGTRQTVRRPLWDAEHAVSKPQATKCGRRAEFAVTTVTLFVKSFPLETVLIGCGLLLLLYGMELTERESLLAVQAGQPITGLPKCAVNPSMFYEDVGVWVPECLGNTTTTAEQDEEDGATISAAYMLSLGGTQNHLNYLARKRYLARHGVDLQRFPAVDGWELFGSEYVEKTVAARRHRGRQPGSDDSAPVRKTVQAWRRDGGELLLPGQTGYLTPGERGYMRSMYTLLKKVYEDPSRKHVLVLDDDALFTCTFERDLAKVLGESR